jgi:hypothetical protein
MKGDPYQILGVSPDATEREIRTAFRTLAKELHPDRNPDNPAATERFNEVAQAWEVLSDPAKKAAWRQRERGRPDAPDPDWLDTFDLILAALEVELKREILPGYVASHGIGFDLMTALRVAVEAGTVIPRLSVPSSRWVRWRTRRLVRSIHFVADESPFNGSILQVRRGTGRHVVVVSTWALWMQGVRTEEAVREILPRVTSAGLLIALAGQLGARGRTPPEIWARRPLWHRDEFWGVVWGLAIVLSIWMVWTAWRQTAGG